ncbi:MAG: hypothetical protein ACLRLD_10330 [Lachnospira sp.]
MIIAGARCEQCGRIDTIPYTSDTAVKVMLRQKGWTFDDDKCICPICIIKNKDKNK